MSWPKVTLGEVAAIDRNGVPPEDIPTGCLFIGLEHIEAGGRILEVPSVETGEISSTKFRFGPNHILYGKLRPYLAKIATPDFSGICSTDILPILPGPKIDKSFLTHFLRQPSIVQLATNRSSGANLPRLSPKALAEFEIPLPPLEEQKRIAAILDKADELRRLRRRAIDRLDTLAQSIFYDMFGDPASNPKGWEVVLCGDLCERLTVGIVVKPASYYVDHGVPAIRGTNIKKSGIDMSDAVFFSPDDNEKKLAKTRVWKNDLVIIRTGQPGLAALVPEELDGANAIDVLIATPDSQRVQPQFLLELLNSESGRRAVLKSQRGQIQQHYNVGALSSAEIIVPPMTLQNEFCAARSRVREQMTIAVKFSCSSETLFSSLQQRAFRGEL